MKLKNLLLICTILGLHVVAKGQGFAIGKGASMITGLASFSSSGSDNVSDSPLGSMSQTVTALSFTPSIDYFIFNNFFVGGDLGYSNQNSSISKITELAIGPEIGYAFGHEDSKVFPYLNAGWNYINYKINETSISISSLSGSGVSFGFGVIVPVKSHIGLVLEGKYNIINYTESSQSVNVFSLNFGLVGLLF
jgi:outer membrane protein W